MGSFQQGGEPPNWPAAPPAGPLPGYPGQPPPNWEHTNWGQANWGQTNWGQANWGPPYPGLGMPPGIPPRPPQRRLSTVAILGLVGVLVLAGVALFIVARSGDDSSTTASGSSKSASPSAAKAKPPGWYVGSCVRMVSGPTDAQLSKIKDLYERRQLEAARRYEPVGCTDSKAVAKITKLGGVTGPRGQVADTGCAPDTDLTLGETGLLAKGRQIYCARNLKPPHPGDPGNGGGDFVAGDCAAVSSSDGVRVSNDRIGETPCGPEGYYAKVLAISTTKAACPAAQTLSRLPLAASRILCLGQGARGLIAKPGECVNLPSNSYYAPTRIACSATSIPFRLVAIVDSPARCPAGTHGRPYTGYDRVLCIRYPDGS